jgi:hypothetical protein
MVPIMPCVVHPSREVILAKTKPAAVVVTIRNYARIADQNVVIDGNREGTIQNSSATDK